MTAGRWLSLARPKVRIGRLTAPAHLDGQGGGAVAIAWRLRTQIEPIAARGREVAGQVP
jgi:hypothetical protein